MHRRLSCAPGFTVVAGEHCLRLIGELDLAAVPALQAGLAELDGRDVVLDCSELTFIDCTGLGALVAAHHGCAGAGSRLTLVAPSGCLTRLLELTGVDGLLPVRAANSER
jgi:anti-anti-sigma factor